MPFHVPVVTVPRLTIFVDPDHVDSAVFSTLFKDNEDFRFKVEVPASVVGPDAYSNSPGVYSDIPVPPRFTSSVPRVSLMSNPSDEVAICVQPVPAELPTSI